MAKNTTNYSLTLPTATGKKIQQKARERGKRQFSKIMAEAAELWLTANK